jgi:hypothetical protein
VGQNRCDHTRIVGNAQLVGNGQQQRVGLGDSFVFPELLDEYMRLGRIAAAENRPGPRIDESDLVLIFTPASEIAAITIAKCTFCRTLHIAWSEIGCTSPSRRTSGVKSIKRALFRLKKLCFSRNDPSSR